MTSTSDITQLLLAWSEGDETALAKLIPMVERELHRIASYYMHGENAGHTLQTTALVNEAYIKLVKQNRVQWQNRVHFYGVAARIMRRILLNYARDRGRIKRGGGALQISLSEVAIIAPEKSAELMALDEALVKLEDFDERKCRVVELRYFGGLSVEETAFVLGVSEMTVMRDWRAAKAWIVREMKNEA
jgi:RNA polymerase sigma factor (TIGR02999 family)